MLIQGAEISRLQREILIEAMHTGQAWIKTKYVEDRTEEKWDKRAEGWTVTTWTSVTYNPAGDNAEFVVLDAEKFIQRVNTLRAVIAKPHPDLKFRGNFVVHIPTGTLRQGLTQEEAQVIGYKLRGGRF